MSSDLHRWPGPDERRLARTSTRRRRSDAGRSRLHPRLLAEIRSSLLGPDRPSITAVVRRASDRSRQLGLRPPSRASVYNLLPRIPGHTYRIQALPLRVRDSLYNLPPDGSIPGPQLVFYCFNYGSLAAVSYAAGLPWLDLFQATRLRGWRARSRGLLDAVIRARGMR
jgi:hypothetical protein